MQSKNSITSNDRLSKGPSSQISYKVVVLGVASVGKSSLTLMYVNNTFSNEYNPTLQDTFKKNFLLEDQTTGILGIIF